METGHAELTPPTDATIRAWFELQSYDVQERFSERAAIMEYEGGLSRRMAELEAFKTMRRTQ